jgi:hypothetical protein
VLQVIGPFHEMLAICEWNLKKWWDRGGHIRLWEGERQRITGHWESKPLVHQELEGRSKVRIKIKMWILTYDFLP